MIVWTVGDREVTLEGKSNWFDVIAYELAKTWVRKFNP